ncbi:MAG: DUF5320 domain-containing protein [Myxococcales bacterium]|nr:DUF5320 domain-containing protein [Myxococcales bacterium]
MGPMGQGPMTGGGRGWCSGVAPRFDTTAWWPGFGMGRSYGRGGGWRHRHWFHATGLTGWQRAQMGWPGLGAAFPTAVSKEQELAALKQQAAGLEQALGALKSRIQELDKPAPDTSNKEHE